MTFRDWRSHFSDEFAKEFTTELWFEFTAYKKIDTACKEKPTVYKMLA